MSHHSTSNHPAVVGLLGLGLVGSELAGRWLADGRSVVGYDIGESARAAHAARGGQVAASIDDLFSRCGQAVVLSLPDSTTVRQVFDAHDRTLAAGALVIDTTTGDPADAVQCAARLERQGVRYVEATLIGSSRQIGAGESVGLFAGATDSVQEAGELLSPFTSRQFAVGTAGAASRMKLIVNLVLGLNRAVLAEGLALAEAAGVDLAQTLEVLQSSPAASRVMETKGPLMLERRFAPPQARLRQHRKDVALIEKLAAAHAQQLPLTAIHAHLLDAALAAGHGEEDNSAIFKVWRPS